MMGMMEIDAIVEFFENLTPERIGELPRYYAPEARFKDPFNDVSGLPAIAHIFRHMYRQVVEPRFVITERVVGEEAAVLIWEFRFRMRQWRRDQAQIVRGATHLRFDATGKVLLHRDYWDAAEELYAKLPALGCLMRGLQRALRA
jgi:steroid delta-isomerase